MTTMQQSVDTIGGRIVEAFLRYGNQWRTVFGIAQDTGLHFEQVSSFMRENPRHFVTSSVTPGGHQIYRLAPGSSRLTAEIEKAAAIIERLGDRSSPQP
ncbi:MAG: hypothetical protein O3A46_01770 [Candidatus Poribacteria bacterium]|nr:hypothetical protein [Candidatus Poribacteria bacterium]